MDLPKRKSPRIPGYDYSSVNFYFITICTSEKKCIFGNKGILNWMGKTAEENLLQIPELNPGICLEKYVVMPNHIHAVLSIQQQGKYNMATVIGQYKMSVTKRIREKKPGIQVWQRSFHDHIIRNQGSFEKIWTYIENNPLKWEEDCFYVDSGTEED